MNNYPYNPYGYNPQQYQEEYRKIQVNSREKREFRKRSMLIALGIILFVLISTILWLILSGAKGLSELYTANSTFSLSIDIMLTVASLFGAYLIVRLLMDRKHEGFIPLALPENKKHALLLIPFGVLSCLAGAYLTSYMNTALEEVFDVSFTMPDLPEPKTPVELLLYLTSCVFVPCIFEEIALRAGALQAMRKYGDWFAIVSSAFVFAILHGNMVQTPFAFVAGIAIGYVYVVTGSIWPGVAIHFINNFASCITSFGSVFSISEDATNLIYAIYMGVFVVAGTVCFIIYVFDKKKPALNKDTTSLKLSQKLTGFVFNIPMIIALLYMGFVTSQYINWN